MLITDICFPIFPIRGYKKIYEESNMLKVDTYVKSWVIDNRNLQGNFTSRRLKMNQETKYPLTLAIFNISQLIKYKSNTNKYIDFYGKLINYKKSRRVKLKYYLVQKIKKGKSKVAIFVEDIPNPIYITPVQWDENYNFDKLWLGLLSYNGGFIFYSWSDEHRGETWRKI